MSFVLQKIKEHFNNQLPFVCYCKPNSEKLIAILQKNDSLFELNDIDSGFAFVSFDNEKRYLIPENQSDIYFENYISSDFVLKKKNDFEIDEKAKSDFEELVSLGIKSIDNGEFEKVVLSRREVVSVENFDLELVFNQLIYNYPTAFKYCFYHPKVGFWIGATPEQFLKTENNSIKTVALAGTQLKIDNQLINWKKKEIEEQKIVSDFIIENLNKFSKNIKVSEPYTFEAGAIVHIKTDIEAELNSKELITNVIDVLHPTPAVCGFPKENAKKFIIENEGYNREFYAGFLGEWNKNFETFQENQSNLFVNLRCMKIENNQASLYIGCGINNGSEPEKEFIETVNKSQTMKKVL